MPALAATVAGSAPSTPAVTIVLKGGNHPETERIVRDALVHAGLKGMFTVRIASKIPANGGAKPHVSFVRFESSGIEIKVRYDSTNDSHFKCYLSSPVVRPSDLWKLIMKVFTGKRFEYPEEVPALAPVIPLPGAKGSRVEDMGSSDSSASQPAAQPPATAPESESDIKPSLEGFSDDSTGPGLALMELQTAFGTREFANRDFRQIMREKKLCHESASNRSIGRVLEWLCKYQFLNRRTIPGGVLYSISEAGKKLADTGILPDPLPPSIWERPDQANTAPSPASDSAKSVPPPALAAVPSVPTNADFEARIAPLRAKVRQRDEAVATLSQSAQKVTDVEARIADMTQQIASLTEAKQGLQQALEDERMRQRNLSAIANDQELIAAAEKLQRTQEAYQAFLKTLD